MRQQFFNHRRFRLRSFRTGADFFLQSVEAFLQGSEVGEDQLGIDDLDVANGIDRAADVMDIATFKAAYNLDDSINLSDVTEELVPEPFAGARAFHQPRDVNELNRCGHYLL